MKISEALCKLDELKSVYGDLSMLLLAKSGNALTTMQIDSIDYMQDIRMKNLIAVFVRSDGLDHMFEESVLNEDL